MQALRSMRRPAPPTSPPPLSCGGGVPQLQSTYRAILELRWLSGSWFVRGFCAYWCFWRGPSGAPLSARPSAVAFPILSSSGFSPYFSSPYTRVLLGRSSRGASCRGILSAPYSSYLRNKSPTLRYKMSLFFQ